MPLLAEHYLRLASVENGFKPKRLAPRAVEFLAPAALARQRARAAQPDGAPGGDRGARRREPPRRDGGAPHDGAPSGEDGAALPLRVARSRFERQYILERLSANRGNLGNTAKELGIERTNLYRKMKSLGIGASQARALSARSGRLRFR